MGHDLVCWKCGASLAELSLPLQRRDECRKCRAELHVCRMCVDYDVNVAKHCREPTAEEVSDKTRANFCGHFAPRAGAYTPPDTAEIRKSTSELDRLFGTPAAATDKPKSSPDDLFGKASTVAADQAKSELDRLFGKK